LLDFIVKFLKAPLSTEFVQEQIHRPVATVVSKLDRMDRACPHATREFIRDVWKQCHDNPIYMDMLSQREATARVYPVLDYLVNSIWIPWPPQGEKRPLNARELLRDFFGSPSELLAAHGNYVCNLLFPKLTEFLIGVCGYVETLQFSGKVSAMAEFCDNIFHCAREFPIMDVITDVQRRLPPSNLFLALAFLLSHFSEPRLIGTILNFCESIADILDDFLEVADTRPAVLALLKCLFTYRQFHAFLLPPSCDAPGDILRRIPSEWMIQSDSEVYTTEADARINAFGGDRASGRNLVMYSHLLKILRQFRELPMQMCLSLTGLIALIVAVAPDLINNELADSIGNVVVSFAGVGLNEVIALDQESSELRLMVFREFVKEVAATSVATHTRDSWDEEEL
jgi:hypothetical protein